MLARRSRFLRSVPGMFFCAVLFLLLFSVSPAAGETAKDITSRCTLKAGSGSNTFSKCTDRNYYTSWTSAGGKNAWAEITAPKGETLSGVWLQWSDHPHAWSVQVPDGDGWAEAGHTEGAYLSEYLPLPEGTTRCRVANAPGLSKKFTLTELRVYGAGDPAPEVQQWTPPAEKADLLMIVAHPDDEVLWFGGTLPLYAGEQGKICQICMMVPTMPYRRLELLDCLWTCGVKNYPVWGKFPDSFSGTLAKQYKHWSKNTVYKLITEWIRRFRPEVLLTHDINGEYGHGAHRVCADAVMHCLKLAANAKKYPQSAKEYGVWDVPKCYLHLYSENVVDMDWHQPLDAFGGKTSFEVAEDAFRCHVSQQETRYTVEDSGPWDCSLFGLYRSLVGADTEKNDFFENLP